MDSLRTPLFLFLGLSVCLPMRVGAQAPGAVGAIEGVVLQEGTSRPLAGVTVRILGAARETSLRW